MQPVDSARSGPIGDGAGRTIRFVYVVTVAVALLVGLAAGLVGAALGCVCGVVNCATFA